MKLLHHLPRFRNAREGIKVLADRESWTRGDIESWQLDRLNELWQTAIGHVEHYRCLVASDNLPSQFDSLDHFRGCMPLLDKRLVRDQPERFLSDRADVGSWHRTGGSTGTPMRVYWSKAAHLESLWVKYRMLEQRGIEIFDRSAFLWGHSGSAAPGLAGLKRRLKRPIEDSLRNRLRLSAYRLGPKDLDEHLERMIRFRPTWLYGYSSAVEVLADAAAKTGRAIPSLRLAILTAEPAETQMLARVERLLGCDTAIEYGSAECGVMALSFPDGSVRVREDFVILETIVNDLGSFDLVVTVLNNPSFPLIRYRIEDVTDRPLDTSGDGFAKLGDIGGRRNDYLMTLAGRRVHSLAVKHVLEHHSNIRRFQAHQQADGRLVLSVETSDPDKVPVNQLTGALTDLLDGLAVEIHPCEQIEGTVAGKHRWVVSEMDR